MKASSPYRYRWSISTGLRAMLCLFYLLSSQVPCLGPWSLPCAFPKHSPTCFLRKGTIAFLCSTHLYTIDISSSSCCLNHASWSYGYG